MITPCLPVIQPGGKQSFELLLEMPLGPVRFRVEVNPNPVDRDPSNDSRGCFFGASMPRNLACTSTLLGDEDSSVVVDITDPITILTYPFLGGDKLRPPYPDSGEDPTADPQPLACETPKACQ
ncbi:MAG: hypothetical protein HY717_11020 [Planctomycetes bacterium]|nr:hypothetical protein [Planctomycetota bacterium]